MAPLQMAWRGQKCPRSLLFFIRRIRRIRGAFSCWLRSPRPPLRPQRLRVSFAEHSALRCLCEHRGIAVHAFNAKKKRRRDATATVGAPGPA